MSMCGKVQKFGPVGPEDAERRAALLKIGKYAAYSLPLVMATIGGARGRMQTVSRGSSVGPTGSIGERGSKGGGGTKGGTGPTGP